MVRIFRLPVSHFPNELLALNPVTDYPVAIYHNFVSDIAIFVLKRDVKLQLTNFITTNLNACTFSAKYDILCDHCPFIEIQSFHRLQNLHASDILCARTQTQHMNMHECITKYTQSKTTPFNTSV